MAWHCTALWMKVPRCGLTSPKVPNSGEAGRQALHLSSTTPATISSWRRLCVHHPPSPIAFKEAAPSALRPALEARWSCSAEKSGGPPILRAVLDFAASRSAKPRTACFMTIFGETSSRQIRVPSIEST